VRVSFQGEAGAYSEEALRTFFPDVDVLPCATFGEALTAVADGQADRAVLPVENSQAGSITETYDLMLQHQLWAVGEIELRVRHATACSRCRAPRSRRCAPPTRTRRPWRKPRSTSPGTASSRSPSGTPPGARG